jgi:ketosteroid isomerase-like protein
MSDKNIELVQKIYAAFGRGDVPAIMELIDEKMTSFGIAAQTNEVPFHRQFTEKRTVPQFFESLAKEVEFLRFEPHGFAAGGDYVYCSIHAETKMKRSGKTLKMEEIHRFTIKNGRVVAWLGTEDTAAVNAAYKT